METPPESSRRYLSLTLAALAWGTTLALTAAIVLRMVWFDAKHFLIWINAFTVYVYLPAYACFIGAMWARRWPLATWNALIVACHLTWVVPAYFTPARSSVAVQSAGIPAKTLRVFYANVRAGNTDFDWMFREIHDANPDLVVLVEFSPNWRRAARQSSIIAKFPYLPNMPYSSPGVFSKLPISNEKFHWRPGRPVFTFDVLLDDQPVRIVCLHGPRPMVLPYHDYFGYWQKAPAILAEQPDPCIVFGDFNATQFSKVYRGLMADGWNSAHQWVGRGYATTWPNQSIWAPPIRIDHVLFRDLVQCLAITEGKGQGSDHRPLVVDLLPYSAAAPPAESP